MGAPSAQVARSAGRQFIVLAVIAFALSRAIARYADSIRSGGDGWSAGEWLISYPEGFVRRGLFGELLLRFAPGGQAGLWVLFGVQVGVYLVVTAYALHALHRSRYSWSMIALAAGPAAIPFIGWVDPGGAFKKELLMFLALVLLGWSRQTRSVAAAASLSLSSLAVFVLAVFSWEASVLLLPAALFLLLHDRERLAAGPVFRWTIAGLFAAIGTIGFTLSLVVHGDSASAAAMCAAMGDQGFSSPELCSGALREGIAWTTKDTLAELGRSYPLYLGYVPLVALALLPALASRWFATHRWWGVALCLGVLPLFFVVTDYGRWTYMLVVAFLIVISADDPGDAWSPLWNPISAVLYVTLWGIPHFLWYEDEFPWLGALSTLSRDLIMQVSHLLGYPLAPGVTGGP